MLKFNWHVSRIFFGGGGLLAFYVTFGVVLRHKAARYGLWWKFNFIGEKFNSVANIYQLACALSAFTNTYLFENVSLLLFFCQTFQMRPGRANCWCWLRWGALMGQITYGSWTDYKSIKFFGSSCIARLLYPHVTVSHCSHNNIGRGSDMYEFTVLCQHMNLVLAQSVLAI